MSRTQKRPRPGAAGLQGGVVLSSMPSMVTARLTREQRFEQAYRAARSSLRANKPYWLAGRVASTLVYSPHDKSLAVAQMSPQNPGLVSATNILEVAVRFTAGDQASARIFRLVEPGLDTLSASLVAEFDLHAPLNLTDGSESATAQAALDPLVPIGLCGACVALWGGAAASAFDLFDDVVRAVNMPPWETSWAKTMLPDLSSRIWQRVEGPGYAATARRLIAAGDAANDPERGAGWYVRAKALAACDATGLSATDPVPYVEWPTVPMGLRIRSEDLGVGWWWTPEELWLQGTVSQAVLAGVRQGIPGA